MRDKKGATGADWIRSYARMRERRPRRMRRHVIAPGGKDRPPAGLPERDGSPANARVEMGGG